MLHTNPNLPRRVDVYCLCHVDAQRGPFDEAEPDHVKPQPDAESMRRRSELVVSQVRITHIVERGEINIAQATDVVAEIVVEVARDRHAPLDAADPDAAPLALGQI